MLCALPDHLNQPWSRRVRFGTRLTWSSYLCLDAGYDYDEVRRIVAAHGYTAHIRPQGEEKKAKATGQRARRWVVERTHS